MFSSVNFWLLFAGTILIAYIAYLAGLQLGKYRSVRTDKTKDVPTGWIMNATIGLLAFMLAFTFGMAASDFDARQRAVVNDANMIRKTYAMAGYLPGPRQQRVKQLLREYVSVRLKNFQSRQNIEESIIRSEAIHDLLWAESKVTEVKGTEVMLSSFFTESLGQMVVAHYERVALGFKVIHQSIWIVLYLLLVLSMSSAGYLAGLIGTRGHFVFLNLAIALALVLMLIADLDRPQQGVFKVNQQPMMELQKRMSVDKF